MMKANAQKRRKLSTISNGTVATVDERGELPQTRGHLRERYRFTQELFQLFNSITAHCYRQLAQKDRTVWERLFWLLMLILEAATLVAIIISAWGKFTANPLITTLHDTIYPIELVPFPAISLCNNNRISRSAALRYARQLAEKDTAERRNVSYFLEQIVLLGKLYDFDYENLHQMTKLQEYLDLHDVSNGTGMYNALETLAKLSPRCEDMLLRCFWKSIELPCMLRNDMIEVRRSQYGFCCTFNFVGHNEDTEIHPPSYFLDVTGPEMGLVLLLNGSSNDYFYNLFNNIGFNLQIFNPHEVPDSTAGGVNEQFVHLGTETFIRIDAITINSEPDVLRYSRQKVSYCSYRVNCTHLHARGYLRSGWKFVVPIPKLDWTRLMWALWLNHTAVYMRERQEAQMEADNLCTADSPLQMWELNTNLPILGAFQRQCVFRSELLKYGANYGRSNCVAACRLRSVMALCECVPFYMPTAGATASSKSVTTCNLQHIACLNKYKIKWSTVITDIVRIPGLEKEMEESLYCPECLPSCSDSKYQITASELPLIRSRRDGFSITAGIDHVEDVAVVRIFFGQPETWMYKQNVAYYWFEIFSNFGGMFGIMAGMSLITLMEVVYFVGRQLVLVFATRSWSARLRARKPTKLELLQ